MVKALFYDYYDSLILPLNIPGRGDYGGFMIAGYLSKDNQPENIFPLYVRRIDQNQYQYYTTNKIDPQLRIPINTGGRELKSGRVITVPGYNRPFKVVIYDADYGAYAPY